MATHPNAELAMTATTYSVKEINQLVDQIRNGKLPAVSEGKELKFYDRALPGFYIRVWHGGNHPVWVVRWKRFGRQQKQTIGKVSVLDRNQAIEAARDLLAKVRLGILDPQAARREAMRAAKVTFESVVEPFLRYKETHERKTTGKLRENTLDGWRRYLTGYYFRNIHKLPIDEITPQQIKACIDTIAKESGPIAAANSWTPMSVLFNWAIDPKGGYLPADHKNPMAHVDRPAPSKARERVLTNEEIQAIWLACEQWEADALRDEQILASGGKLDRDGAAWLPDLPHVIRLLFLTGLRKQEIGDLQWDELDLHNGQIKILASRTKNHRVLHLPLSPMALDILRGIKHRPDRPNVFGQSKKPGRGLVVETNLAVRGVSPRVAKAGKPPLAHWTVHDIRRTFRTRMSQLKVPNHVAAALVGHVGPEETGAVSTVDQSYNRDDYWQPMREALAKWEDLLRSIIDGTAPKIITPRFGQRFAKDG
jgi:integrase